jgi:predicted DNA-binding transcriptional regulator YafY
MFGRGHAANSVVQRAFSRPMTSLLSPYRPLSGMLVVLASSWARTCCAAHSSWPHRTRLGFGEHATVVEPKELKERVRKAAEGVTAKYMK